jgi:two-component sensor histidine kinase
MTEAEPALPAGFWPPAMPAAVLPPLLEAGQIALLTIERGRVSAVNGPAAALLGVPPSQALGLALESLAPPGAAAHPWRLPAWLASLPADHPQAFECPLQRSDGRLLRVSGHGWQEASAPAGQGLAWLALVDLEQRRDAERRTARAQASLQRVIETAPLAIAVFEMPGRRMMQANQAAEFFFGLSMAVLVGRAPSQWPAGTVRHEIAALEASLDLATESPPGVRREIEAAGDDGGTRVWDTRFVSMAPDAGREFPVEATQVLMVANEVTDQRAAEQERFDAAIAQRGMLVQEVHHRIKNNLQGVAGLLQQASARYPEVGPILSEAVGQLQAIAQVYGLQVGSGGPVQLAGLLQAVAQSVQRTFNRPIEVAVTGEDAQRWRLPEAEAIPVALTVNELLTNALKHGGQHPVECCLRAAAPEVTIEIVNRGRLRDGFDLRARTGGVNGLGLVRALLPRRSAELSLRQEGDRVVTQVTLRPPAVRRDG